MPDANLPLTDLFTNDDGMYPLEINNDGSTKHSRHCRAAFGRLDWHCHRCCELMLGAAPRKGWQRPYFRKKLRQAHTGRLF